MSIRLDVSKYTKPQSSPVPVRHVPAKYNLFTGIKEADAYDELIDTRKWECECGHHNRWNAVFCENCSSSEHRMGRVN